MGISLKFLTHCIRIFLRKRFLLFPREEYKKLDFVLRSWLDNPVNHYRMESAVSDNRPLRGVSEDLVYIHQEPCYSLANSMKSACSFQTNHNSISCTHVKLSNLVFKRSTNFYKVATSFVKLSVFYGQGNHDIPSAFAIL